MLIEYSLDSCKLKHTQSFCRLSNVVCAAFNHFDWTLFALIYQSDDNGGCNFFQRDMEVKKFNRSFLFVCIRGVATNNIRLYVQN